MKVIKIRNPERINNIPDGISHLLFLMEICLISKKIK